MNKKVTVTQQEGADEVPTEVLAQSIAAIAEGVRKLRTGRLNDRALVLLIQHASPSVGVYKPRKIGTVEVRAVLDGIDALEATYLRKKPIPGPHAVSR
jgi:hypothetical protein